MVLNLPPSAKSYTMKMKYNSKVGFIYKKMTQLSENNVIFSITFHAIFTFLWILCRTYKMLRRLER